MIGRSRRRAVAHWSQPDTLDADVARELLAVATSEPAWKWVEGGSEDGIRQAMQGLEKLTYDKLHFVLGLVSDKSPDKVLALLPPSATYYFAKANIPRGLDAGKLKEKAASFGLNGKAYSSVRKALAAAKRKARPGDLIYVGGSIFVVAEVI